MQPEDLARSLEQADRPWIIDVRSAVEYHRGHIPGALHLPFWVAMLQRQRLPEDKQARIVLTCEHGPRAQLAATQLGLLGYQQVDLLEGHMSRWRREGLPIEL